MSEMKAKHVVDVYDDYAEHPCEELSQVYLKAEADKVIADLEESHKKEVEQLLIEIVELKGKYKELAKLHDKAIQNSRGEVMARDCKKCVYFQGMHPNYSDSFACQLDPNCSWMEYKEKKVCKNYEEKEK